MLLIGVDYHPSFQTIAFFVEETGECGEQELNHNDGEAERFYLDLKQRGILGPHRSSQERADRRRLDVFEGEPKLNPEYVSLKNTFLLPRIGSATIETRTVMVMLALDNVDAVLNGRPAPTLVQS